MAERAIISRNRGNSTISAQPREATTAEVREKTITRSYILEKLGYPPADGAVCKAAEVLINFKCQHLSVCSLDAEVALCNGKPRLDFLLEFDFLQGCEPIKLNIEIDDDNHLQQHPADCQRDRIVAKHGFVVLRYYWREIIRDPRVIEADLMELLPKLMHERFDLIRAGVHNHIAILENRVKTLDTIEQRLVRSLTENCFESYHSL